MPTAQIKDNELFFTIEGSGIPCLVMHGGLGLDHTYLQVGLKPLTDTLELIYYDHRGNGRSGNPDRATLTHEQFAADADALAEYLGHTKLAVLGHSYGGFIALEMALRYPARITHLILFETAPAFNYGEEIQQNIARQNPSAEVLQALQREITTNAEFQQSIQDYASLYFKNFDPQVNEALLKNVICRLEGQPSAEETQAYNVTSRLGEIDIPTLILVGREDFICPPSQAKILHQGIPNSKLVIFEESGHFPNVEEPDLFFSTIRNWFQNIPDTQ